MAGSGREQICQRTPELDWSVELRVPCTEYPVQRVLQIKEATSKAADGPRSTQSQYSVLGTQTTLSSGNASTNSVPSRAAS
jgi:hypothetical protein